MNLQGCIINCIIPKFYSNGAAGILKGPVMGEFGKSKLTNVWANSDTLDKVKDSILKLKVLQKNKKFIIL